MKLIDADAINFEDMCDCCPSADCGDCPSPEGFASWLKKQPTAYDPDKIVEQLEEYKNLECDDPNEDIDEEVEDAEELYDLGRSQGKLEAYLILIAVVLHTFGVGLNVAAEGFKEYIGSIVVIVISIVVLIV